MKKLLLSLGIISSIVLPVISVISCGNHAAPTKTNLEKAKTKSKEKIKDLGLTATDKTSAENLVKKATSEDELDNLMDNLKDPEKKETLLDNDSFKTKKIVQYKEPEKPDLKLDDETLKELNNVLGLDIKVSTYKNKITSVDGVLRGTIELDFTALKSGSIGDLKVNSGQEINLILTPPKIDGESIEVKILVNGIEIELNKEKSIPIIVKLLDTFTKNLEPDKELVL